MPDAFNADAAAGIDVVFQFIISGEDGGDWYCVVKDGACEVSAGIHDRPTCSLNMAAADFLEMISGSLFPVQAYTSGKLSIDGDMMASQLIEKLFKF